MACAGFTCSKNTLAALNVLYILVGIILIGVAAYSRLSAIITSVPIVGGIIACGIFLCLVAIIGLVGAIKHHQVLLFFYMIILFLLFLIQFAIACACLAVNKEQQKVIAETGWKKADKTLKTELQTQFNCCGFTEESWKRPHDDPLGHPSCGTQECCKNKSSICCRGDVNATLAANQTSPWCDGCETCWTKVEPYMDSALKITGGTGLFFSFTEIFGVWVTIRYRNQKDPRANPSAFL